MGQFLRNSLFLQAFYEGRDRGGIFGKSRLISSAYVLSMMCKTPESNKSLESYNADVHRVRYLKEEIDQNHATVYTEIASKRDLPAAVEYRQLHKDGNWKVYDIVIEGVSL